MTLKDFDNQSFFVMVLIELSAVFNVIDHANLYQKLETTIGIHGKFLGLDKIKPLQQAPTCCHWNGYVRLQPSSVWRSTKIHPQKLKRLLSTTRKNNYNCRI